MSADTEARAAAIEARTEADRAHKAINEAFGLLGGLSADVAATRREVREARRMNAALVAIAVACIGGITQFQVARVAALKPKQDDAAVWLQRQRDADAIEARLASRLDLMQTEIERVRRNAPAPLGQKADDVTGKASRVP